MVFSTIQTLDFKSYVLCTDKKKKKHQIIFSKCLGRKPSNRLSTDDYCRMTF